jgi:hypothetical protein
MIMAVTTVMAAKLTEDAGVSQTPVSLLLSIRAGHSRERLNEHNLVRGMADESYNNSSHGKPS